MDTLTCDDDFRVKYPTPHFSLFRFPLSILDDFEVALRTAIAIGAAVAICVYEDTETVVEEFPLCFLMAIVCLALSLVPFVGAVISHGMSFLWGALLGTFAVLLVVEILGSDTDSTLVSVPAATTCIAPPIFLPRNTTVPTTIPIIPFNATTVYIDVEGDYSDPSKYGLGALIFLGTFLFVFFGESQFFILGSCISYNLYLAYWYGATQTPLRPIPDTGDFFKFTRTILIGVSIALASFLLPLPRAIPTFIPQPRFASSVIFTQLGSISKKLGDNFVDIVTLFDKIHDPDIELNIKNIQAITNARFLLLNAVLNGCNAILRKLIILLKFAAQYEPIWFPLPLPHFTTVSRIRDIIREYQILILYQSTMLRAMKIYANTTQSKPVALPKELRDLISEFSKDVGKIGNFHYQGNPFFCIYDETGLNIDWDGYREKFINTISDVHGKYYGGDGEGLNPNYNGGGIDSNSNAINSGKLFNLGFHVYFFWCLSGVCSTVIEIEKLRKLPNNRLMGIFLVLIDWPLHLLGWGIEYILNIFKVFIELFNMIRCKKNDRPIKFFQHHYPRVFGSLLCGLSAFIAFLFVLVDDWRTKLPTSTTVIIMAVVVLDRNQPSGGFRNGILRLAGSSLGVASAFCVVIWFDDTLEDGVDDGLIMGALVIFAFIGRLIMQNQKYLYIAFTFIVTNIFLLLAISVDFNTFIGITGFRAVSIGIGISIATLCMILWPVSARERLKHSVKKVVSTCNRSVYNSLNNASKERKDLDNNDDDNNDVGTKLINNYLNGENNDTLVKITKEINLLEILLLQQDMMAKNAEFEPDLFSTPFPTNDYLQLLKAEQNLVDDSLVLTHIMKVIKKRNGEIVISNELIEKLRESYDATAKRCTLLSANPYSARMEIEKLENDFFGELPSFEEILNYNDPLEIIRSCSLLFSIYFVIIDLKLLNIAITNIVANSIGNSVPTLEIKLPRRTFEKFL